MKPRPPKRQSKQIASRRSSLERLEQRQLLTAVAAGSIAAATYTTNIEWTDTSQPYVLTGDVHVQQGATLNISAGVKVVSPAGKQLYLSDDGLNAKIIATGAIFNIQVDTYGSTGGSIIGSTFNAAPRLDSASYTTLSLTGNTFPIGAVAAPAYAFALAGNTFGPGSTVYILGSRSVTADTTWPALANVSQYDIVYDGTNNSGNYSVYVQNGAKLTIANGSTVNTDNLGSRYLSVASDGLGSKIVADHVTFGTRVYIYSTATGSLTNDTFQQYLQVNTPGSAGLNVSGNLFNTAPQFDVAGGSVLTLTGNTLSQGVYVHPMEVPALVGNTFGANSTVYILGSRSVTADTTWPALANVSQYDIVYDGTNNSGNYSVYVQNGAKLTIANGSTVNTDNLGSRYLSVASDGLGSKIVADHVTFGTRVYIYSTATGSLTNDTFQQYLQVNTPGSAGLNVSGNLFNTAPQFDVAGGSVLTLTGNTLSQGVYVHPMEVPALVGNTFGANSTVYVLGSRSVTADTTWPALANVSQYDIVYDGTNNSGNYSVYVQNGAKLTIANGSTVNTDNLGSRYLSVASDGLGSKIVADHVTFGTRVYIYSTATGSLTNDTFQQYLQVNTPGSAGLNVSGNLFNTAPQFDVAGGSVLTLTGNTLSQGVYVHPMEVPALVGNTFGANSTVYVLGSRSVTADTTWPALANVSQYDIVYDGTNNSGNYSVYVQNGAKLTIANGSTVNTDNLGSRYLSVSADGSSAALLAAGVTFNSQVVLSNNAKGTLQYDAFNSTLTVSAAASAYVHNNSFANGSVAATGAASAVVDLTNNWWGATDSAMVLSHISDHHNNASLPTVSYSPILLTNPVLPDLSVTTVTPASAHLTAGQVTTVSFTVTNLSAVVSAANSGATITLSSGSSTRSVGIADIPALAAGASYAGTATIVLPAATDSFYSSIPGVVGVTVTADSFNQLIERYENNNVLTTYVSVSVLPGYIAPLAGSTYSWDNVTGNLVVSGGTVILTSDSALDTADPTPNVTLNGSSTGLVINTSQHLGTLSIGGTDYAVVARSSGGQYVLSASTLSITGGRLDLANNAADFSNMSLAIMTASVAAGFNGGTWTGAGTQSSAAAGNPLHLTALGVIQNNQGGQGGTPVFSASRLFDGVTPGAADVLVKYTYFGDANLDGKVDGSDYSRIDNGVLTHGAATGWFNGDFNYDGVIDGSDYTLIDNVYNRQSTAVPSSLAAKPAGLPAAATSPAVTDERKKKSPSAGPPQGRAVDVLE